LTWDATTLEDILRSVAAELNLSTGEFFGLLRAAITGRTAAPPLFQTMAVLGKDKCLKRMKMTLPLLSTCLG
jgi:glutamyl-tRNA synthetase